MTLLFKTQRVGAFVARREVARPRQKLSLLASGLGFSTGLDGHLPHRAQRPPRSALPALPRDEPSATTWATRLHFPRPPGSVPRERVSLPPLAAPSLPKPVHLGTGVTAQGAHGLHQLGQLLSRRRCWKRYGEVCIEAEPQWQKGSPEASNGTEERGLTGFTGSSGVAGATPLPEAILRGPKAMATERTRETARVRAAPVQSSPPARPPACPCYRAWSVVPGVPAFLTAGGEPCCGASARLGDPLFAAPFGCRCTTFGPFLLSAQQPQPLPCVPGLWH